MAHSAPQEHLPQHARQRGTMAAAQRVHIAANAAREKHWVLHRMYAAKSEYERCKTMMAHGKPQEHLPQHARQCSTIAAAPRIYVAAHAAQKQHRILRKCSLVIKSAFEYIGFKYLISGAALLKRMKAPQKQQ